RARASAGSPGATPVRRFPTSTSTSTSTTTPSDVATRPRAATLSAWSTTISVSGASETSRMRRRMAAGATTSVVIRSPRIPARASTSASPSFAHATPRAPAAIWRRAISGHLWVFAWGRSCLPWRATCSAILWTFRSKRSRSSSRAGVGMSSRGINGHFSTGFARTAEAYGVECERVEVPYGDGAPADELERRLRADAAHQLKALLVVHNETSTGVTSNVAAVRAALDRAQHPALLLVDTVSSLASIDVRFDDWGVDVALTGPQKGLMLPPGMAILAVSEKALTASDKARCPR